MSVTLTNAEKQARYREHDLVSMARKSASDSISMPEPVKNGGLARQRGYTITSVVEELAEPNGG
jgi:hypothetical protein